MGELKNKICYWVYWIFWELLMDPCHWGSTWMWWLVLISIIDKKTKQNYISSKKKKKKRQERVNCFICPRREHNVIHFNQGNSWMYWNVDFTVSLLQMPSVSVCSKNALDFVGCLNRSPLMTNKIGLTKLFFFSSFKK